ncbi:MAG: carbohydrate-binding protein [Firmicutes bacterium]|nr:carbohydrate-binding protein [Bacillota bacterium]
MDWGYLRRPGSYSRLCCSTIGSTLAVPNTGGWQTWQDISESVTLPAGTHTLYLYVVQGGFNLNYITFQ